MDYNDKKNKKGSFNVAIVCKINYEIMKWIYDILHYIFAYKKNKMILL